MNERLAALALALCACTAQTGAPTSRTLTPAATTTTIDPFEPYAFGPDTTTVGEDEPIDSPLAELDEDGDGVVDEGEMASGMFTLWDADDNGVLDPDELAGARGDFSPGVSEGRLAGLGGASRRAETARLDAFEYYDDDGDGALTPEELTDSMVAAWDQDGDGVVDRAEWPS